MSRVTSDSIDWQPPALSTLNLDPYNPTVCQAVGAWEAKIVNINQDERLGSLPFETILEFVLAIFPPGIPQPDNLTLLLWHNDYLIANETEVYNLIDFALEKCSADVCKNLNWVGDQDASGRGMLITYFVAAMLVTLYLGVLVLSRLEIFKRRYPASSKTARFVSGFEESINTFLDTALIFAFALVVATCFRLSQTIWQAHDPERGHWILYADIASIYMSNFSIFLPLLLQSVAPDLRLNWLRGLFWILIAIISIVNECLFDSFFARITKQDPLDTNPEDILEETWLLYCEPIELYYSGLYPTLRLAQALLLLNAIYYVTYKSCIRKTRGVSRWPRLKGFWQTASRYIQGFDMVLSFMLMWTMLGLFYIYRMRVNDAAGDTNQNTSWTFGQVMAMATWIPVLLEYLSIIKYGPEKGLSRRLSRRFVIVAAKKPVELNEGEARYSRVENEHQMV
ncbi:hypothetical protein GGR54DRAFT_627459 [Hypoxylon sp. NC1633]|nr:hypothetical protein GGR54DRAFT_627459 [Hypoxylon sp. NC1633]